MPTLHKTKHFTDNQRATLLRSAMTQEQAIKEFFSKEVDAFTVEDVYYHLRAGRLIGVKVPITSVRRGFSNLTKEGYLEKTNEVEQGEMKVNIHKWKRKTGTAIATLFQ